MINTNISVACFLINISIASNTVTFSPVNDDEFCNLILGCLLLSCGCRRQKANRTVILRNTGGYSVTVLAITADINR